jgi:alkanesulfonate monooxygenase SsuD/methylene tetrahydromethanopterin reductase-like flavin-dependent oxidoreductase (luciferase family)
MGASPAPDFTACTSADELSHRTAILAFGATERTTGFRNPALLAKMADTVDEISNGRLILGLGAGWYEPEFRAVGFPFDHRFGRFEESLQIIHGLLRAGTIDFDGQYYKARDCELRPRGPRRAGPPLLIGARADRPRSLRLAAQYADYWNTTVNAPKGLAFARQAVDGACIKVGRDPAELHRTAHVLIDLPGSNSSQIPVGVRTHRSARVPAIGTPEDLAEQLKAFAREGVSHVQLWLEPNMIAGIDDFLPVLELLDRG